MRKDIKRYVEAELRFYHETKKEYEFLKDDLISIGSINSDSPGSKTNETSDPTQRNTIKLMTNKRLGKMDETLTAIEKVLNGLDDVEQDFIRLRYWNNKYTMDGIACKLNCSKRTLYNWRDKICKDIASRMGLIN